MATETKKVPTRKAPKANTPRGTTPKAAPKGVKTTRVPLKTIADAIADGQVGKSQLPRLRGYNVTPGERWAEFEKTGKIVINLTELVERLNAEGVLRKAGLASNKAERRAMALRYAQMQQIGWSRMGEAKRHQVTTAVARDPEGPVTLTVTFR